MAWRDMTQQEQATRPEVRLGGALLWVALAAAVVCILAIGGAIFAFDQLRLLGVRYMVAVGFAGVWSLVFVVMTLQRLPATPMVASAGFLAWIAWRFAVALWSQAGWPLAVDLMAEAVLAAGFCGYMADGVRPNAYYRRRLPAA
jgi:hypothetical protein